MSPDPRGGKRRCARRVASTAVVLFVALPARSLEDSASASAPSMERRSARSASESVRPARVESRGGLGGLGSEPGKEAGMDTPGVRKKRVGEAKESKHEEGRVKRCCLSLCRSWSVNGILSDTGWRTCGVLVSEGEDSGCEGSLVVATPVQSKIPLRTMRLCMFTAEVFEVRDSVNAREVARVPPR